MESIVRPALPGQFFGRISLLRCPHDSHEGCKRTVFSSADTTINEILQVKHDFMTDLPDAASKVEIRDRLINALDAAASRGLPAIITRRLSVAVAAALVRCSAVLGCVASKVTKMLWLKSSGRSCRHHNCLPLPPLRQRAAQRREPSSIWLQVCCSVAGTPPPPLTS